ncbi:hypothetical protein AMQ83_31335 [Paenibacillus riograndensis]|nr:hypothetical protein AMQ83_31335 [Paenibacillus riograndensis]
MGNTEDREIQRSINNIGKDSVLKESILRDYRQNRENASDSYRKIDWCDLYASSKSIMPKKKWSVDQNILKQMVQQIIDDMDLE